MNVGVRKMRTFGQKIVVFHRFAPKSRDRKDLYLIDFVSVLKRQLLSGPGKHSGRRLKVRILRTFISKAGAVRKGFHGFNTSGLITAARRTACGPAVSAVIRLSAAIPANPCWVSAA